MRLFFFITVTTKNLHLKYKPLTLIDSQAIKKSNHKKKYDQIMKHAYACIH